MILQIYNDVFINTDQVNYIAAFTDIADNKEKLYIQFINKSSINVPITMEEFIKVLKEAHTII